LDIHVIFNSPPLKVSSKLAMLAGTALAGVICVSAIALSQLNHSLVESRKSEIATSLTKVEHLVSYYRVLESDGKISRESAQAGAKAALNGLNSDAESYYWVSTSDGVNLVNPNAALVGTRTGATKVDGDEGITETQVYEKALANHHIAFVDVPVPHTHDGQLVPKLQGVVAIPGWNWLIGTGFFYDDINTAYWHLAKTLVGVALTILLLVVAISWFMTRSIGRALGGEPADAVAFAGQIAKGNLGAEIAISVVDRSSLLYELSEMRTKLRELVQGIQHSSDSIATGSSEIALGNADLSQRTEEQAASLQETASSIEQITATVKHNADNARLASQLAEQAADSTDRGSRAVDEVVGTIQSIADESRKIGQISGVIEGIAFQTNILALNAAVEAARAGDEGRGFAVVAGEVRALAQRSAAAAKDIRGLIDASVARVDDVIEKVAVAGVRMHEIVQSIKRVSEIVIEIAAASVEQSAVIEQINLAVSQIDEVTHQNAALVEEAAAAAASLDEQASHLRATVGVFRLEC
jgi:methyl-accepting chemotaxis protein